MISVPELLWCHIPFRGVRCWRTTSFTERHLLFIISSEQNQSAQVHLVADNRSNVIRAYWYTLKVGKEEKLVKRHSIKFMINELLIGNQINQMKGMNKTLGSILLLFFISYGITTKAQDVTSHNIKWCSLKTKNTGEENIIEEFNSLICYKKDRIEWGDQNGQVRRALQVMEVIAEWNSPDQEDGLRYDGIYSTTIDVRKAAGRTTSFITVIQTHRK